MAPDRDKVAQQGDPEAPAAAPKLRAKFVAATFRFNDKTAGGGT
jgi:hypothetical protein